MGSVSALTPSGGVAWVPQTTSIVFDVDDDVSVRELLKLRVPRAGCAVETFGTAKEFLARERPGITRCSKLHSNPPDGNGLNNRKSVAADAAITPGIVPAAFADTASAVQAMKAGAVEFLTKPFCDSTLLSVIEEAVLRGRAALLNSQDFADYEYGFLWSRI